MSKESRRRAIERVRAAEKRKRRQRLMLAVGSAVVVIGAAVGITLAVTGGSSGTTAGSGAPRASLAPLATLGALQPAPAGGPAGAEQVPVPSAAPLAGPSASLTGQTLNGISCNTSEQTLFHIHAHLTVFVNGAPRQVPAGIGIPGAQTTQTAAGPFVETGQCFYWLHTHAPDGIIHIESPVQRTFTLGDFFDEWGQPLSASAVGPAKGHVTALYNGKVFTGNPRDIPLTAHAQIQLEVGSPLVSPEAITFPNGL